MTAEEYQLWWRRVREAAYLRCGGVCERCRVSVVFMFVLDWTTARRLDRETVAYPSGDKWTVRRIATGDHLVPVRAAGRTSAANVRVLCMRCHDERNEADMYGRTHWADSQDVTDAMAARGVDPAAARAESVASLIGRMRRSCRKITEARDAGGGDGAEARVTREVRKMFNILRYSRSEPLIREACGEIWAEAGLGPTAASWPAVDFPEGRGAWDTPEYPGRGPGRLGDVAQPASASQSITPSAGTATGTSPQAPAAASNAGSVLSSSACLALNAADGPHDAATSGVTTCRSSVL